METDIIFTLREEKISLIIEGNQLSKAGDELEQNLMRSQRNKEIKKMRKV